MVAVMYVPGSLRVMSVCDGPDRTGFCPRVAVAEQVPCSGYEIVLSRDEYGGTRGGIRRPRWKVPAHATVCPLLGRQRLSDAPGLLQSMYTNS